MVTSVPTTTEAPHHLLIFTKHPHPGFAKTRLIPSQGAQAASHISQRLTEHTLTTVRQLQAARPGMHTLLHHANPPSIAPYRTETWLRPNARETLLAQTAGSLGDRLIAAFTRSFQPDTETATMPVTKVVVIGTDAPQVSTTILARAFAALDRADVVIGPCVDGGYYLLGMTKLHSTLFQNIPWSTCTVCADTVSAAHRLNLSVEKLEMLRDIDDLDDLLASPPLTDLHINAADFGTP